MLSIVEKYIDFHTLFMTMSVLIAYEYITKEPPQFVIHYK